LALNHFRTSANVRALASEGYLLLHHHVHQPAHETRPPAQRGKVRLPHEMAGMHCADAFLQFSNNKLRVANCSHTYRFEVNVLAVNREIRDEANDVLMKNHFVAVSYRWAQLGYWKHSMDLPIVTENQSHIANFQKHILRVHVKGPNRFSKGESLESFLILAADLPRFRSMLLWHCYCYLPPANLMVDELAQPRLVDLDSEPQNLTTILLLSCE
jgi:hypothetical protein